MAACECLVAIITMFCLIGIVTFFLTFKLTHVITKSRFTRKYEEEFGVTRKPELKKYGVLYEENIMLKQQLKNIRKSKKSYMDYNQSDQGE